MLEDLKKLDDSITGSQTLGLREALGDDLYSLLDLALESETEVEASERVSNFVKAAKRSPLKIIKARRLLDEVQKELVMKFLDP